MQSSNAFHRTLGHALASLHRSFDATATWVTRLSWWKFFLFAAVTLVAASILQDELFSGGAEEIVIRDGDARKDKPESNIVIDDSGIRFNLRKPKRPPTPPTTPAPPTVPPTPAGQEHAGTFPEAPEVPETPEVPEAPETPEAAATPEPPALPKPPSHMASIDTGEEVHIDLPPQIGEELSNAIEAAVEDKAEQKVTQYHKQASTWFKSFVSLLVLALFATKALMGGKKRAEAETQNAHAAAERASMQRQLSETRMQMMQAQVEPHFLFNTLASVEYLIETNPPRASAMQHSLIQYLRAVLPQMRDNAVVTNLGREADMVQAYLNLLKMRMEERLEVDMNIPDFLRGAAFPPMMLQSMVENAIKHGLECKPEGGKLRIVAEVVGVKLRVTVTDNGVGFGVVPSNGTGLGLPTIRERLKLLHGDQAQLHIAANLPSGVIATIEVPYQQAVSASVSTSSS